MQKEIKQINLSFDDFDMFYQSLEDVDLIYTTLYKDIVNMLVKLNFDLFEKQEEAEEIKMFFALFFVFFENGNICVPLNADELHGALDKLLSNPFSSKTSKGIHDIFNTGINFINNAIANSNFQKLIQEEYHSTRVDFNQSCPFVLYKREKKEDFLYPSKYFRAKLDIENRIKSLFANPKVKYGKSNNFKYNNAQDYNSNVIANITKKVFPLNSEQFEAVRRGRSDESLFITGGAGTGKTTAVFYLLKELIESNKDISEDDIYLLAPSGKAADRLTESIIKSLDNINDDKRNDRAFSIIEKLRGNTIHSLLHYSLKDERFEYNRSNKIGNENSIFIIDEASMIDVLVFADLLNAICDESKVYILGDPNQLPSVEAGAVLGSLLDTKNTGANNHTIHLIKCNRFNDESIVSNLAKSIIEEDGYLFKEFMASRERGMWKSLNEFKKFEENDIKNSDKKYPVFCFDLNQDSGKDAKNINFSEILKEYFSYFYFKPIYPNKEGICKVCYDLKNLQSKSKDARKAIRVCLDDLFRIQENARILTSNRSGYTGCENINKFLSAEAKINYKKCFQENDKGGINDIFFPGELVIITKNIRNLDLSNGDNGIVIRIKDKDDNTIDCIVLKKPIKEMPDDDFEDFPKISRFEDYLFYPLSLIPSDSIELAYAITIHKSQGSGYNNILIFLPEDENSPLLNRQILYTAITRTQGNTYIISSVDNFKRAQKNNIRRWTEIEI